MHTMYQPLDTSRSEIRLLQLLPGATHEPIQAGLRNVDLDSKGLKYNALSYEWGSLESQHEVLIDGNPFHIRQNLWNALHLFRSLGLHGPFWIDAICVNQSDIPERNSQVKLMYKIYSEATLVRIWLGEEGERSGEALALIWKISRFVQDVIARQRHAGQEQPSSSWEALGSQFSNPGVKDNVKYLDLLAFFDASLQQEESCKYCSSHRDDRGSCSFAHLRYRWQDILCSSDEQWLALSCLLNRSYWSRVWIVQEYVLAKNKAIHCGKHIIDSGDRAINQTYGTTSDLDMGAIESALCHILALDLHQHTRIPPRVRDSIFEIQNSPGTLIMKYATPWLSERRSLLELLIACKNSKATEPRDRIYAMLGLSWDIWDFDVEFDYSKPISQIKLDMLSWYVSSDVGSRQQLWSVLNEILPEKLGFSERRALEKKAQEIIAKIHPAHPHISDVKLYLEEFDIIFNSLCEQNPRTGASLPSLDNVTKSSASVRG